LHAFDGKVGHALNAVANGYCISLPPTTLLSRQKQKLARAVPLDGLLLESDTPALGPQPGARSLPEHVALVAEKVAELKGVDVAVVAEAVRANTRRVFGV
jgi:TatD DNase family protein